MLKWKALSAVSHIPSSCLKPYTSLSRKRRAMPCAFLDGDGAAFLLRDLNPRRNPLRPPTYYSDYWIQVPDKRPRSQDDLLSGGVYGHQDMAAGGSTSWMYRVAGERGRRSQKNMGNFNDVNRRSFVLGFNFLYVTIMFLLCGEFYIAALHDFSHPQEFVNERFSRDPGSFIID